MSDERKEEKLNSLFVFIGVVLLAWLSLAVAYGEGKRAGAEEYYKSQSDKAIAERNRQAVIDANPQWAKEKQ